MAKEPKKPRKPKAPPAPANAMSVAAHPRAAYAVTRAKGIGGLIGVLLVGLLSWRAGAPLLDVGLRALAAGVVGYLAFWALALQAWRHLIVAEARAAAGRAAERAEAAAASATDGA